MKTCFHENEDNTHQNGVPTNELAGFTNEAEPKSPKRKYIGEIKKYLYIVGNFKV